MLHCGDMEVDEDDSEICAEIERELNALTEEDLRNLSESDEDVPVQQCSTEQEVRTGTGCRM